MKDEELIEVLVEKAKKHDEEAFTELINNIENQMYRIALLKLKVKMMYMKQCKIQLF